MWRDQNVSNFVFKHANVLPRVPQQDGRQDEDFFVRSSAFSSESRRWPVTPRATALSADVPKLRIETNKLKRKNDAQWWVDRFISEKRNVFFKTSGICDRWKVRF
jgi:hypothetical protein